MKHVNLTIKNASSLKNAFNSFLKKFSNLEKSILLKFYSSSVSSSMSNLQKSVVKYHKTVFNNLYTVEGVMPEPIYLPLMIGDKLTKVLAYFGDSQVTMQIFYDVIDDKNVGLKIVTFNEELNMELTCSQISLFKVSMQLTDVILERISDTSTQVYDLTLTQDVINNLKNLSDDNDSDEVYFIANNKGIFFKGSNFEYKISSETTFNNSYIFSKMHIRNLDSGDYQMHILDDKGIFKSTSEDNIVIISRLIE